MVRVVGVKERLNKGGGQPTAWQVGQPTVRVRTEGSYQSESPLLGWLGLCSVSSRTVWKLKRAEIEKHGLRLVGHAHLSIEISMAHVPPFKQCRDKAFSLRTA